MALWAHLWNKGSRLLKPYHLILCSPLALSHSSNTNLSQGHTKPIFQCESECTYDGTKSPRLGPNQTQACSNSLSVATQQWKRRRKPNNPTQAWEVFRGYTFSLFSSVYKSTCNLDMVVSTIVTQEPYIELFSLLSYRVISRIRSFPSSHASARHACRSYIVVTIKPLTIGTIGLDSSIVFHVEVAKLKPSFLVQPVFRSTCSNLGPYGRALHFPLSKVA